MLDSSKSAVQLSLHFTVNSDSTVVLLMNCIDDSIRWITILATLQGKAEGPGDANAMATCEAAEETFASEISLRF